MTVRARASAQAPVAARMSDRLDVTGVTEKDLNTSLEHSFRSYPGPTLATDTGLQRGLIRRLDDPLRFLIRLGLHLAPRDSPHEGTCSIRCILKFGLHGFYALRGCVGHLRPFPVMLKLTETLKSCPQLTSAVPRRDRFKLPPRKRGATCAFVQRILRGISLHGRAIFLSCRGAGSRYSQSPDGRFLQL